MGAPFAFGLMPGPTGAGRVTEQRLRGQLARGLRRRHGETERGTSRSRSATRERVHIEITHVRRGAGIVGAATILEPAIAGRDDRDSVLAETRPGGV